MEGTEKFEKHYKYDIPLKGDIVGRELTEEQHSILSVICRRCVSFCLWIFTIDNNEYRVMGSTVEELLKNLRGSVGVAPSTPIKMGFPYQKAIEISTTWGCGEVTLASKLKRCGVQVYSCDCLQ